ncbi:mannitol dehydrogenase [Subtercola boreus]|uniref:Mannitol-1-phosphate 5-dehydrogenase n=1 Tax=Subtercola boreus TaxID=120213 RepID=A0A3E0VZA4_9MICO|nr:mannitol dehydrogenase family protein [Subtercola boreus]RFA15071.1 mannitol dehydrogenase [Subtercola boreus]
MTAPTSSSIRLTGSTLARIGSRVATPAYDRASISIGVVHFGVGSFHRSHEAMFLDRFFNAGGDPSWGICGVGLLPQDARMRDVLTRQDGLYTLLLREPEGAVTARVIGSITRYLFAPDDPGKVLDTLVAPSTRIVSLTVTEAGYSVNDATGLFDATGENTRAELREGAAPVTVFGFLTEALRLRRENGTAPFTVMSCDNIPGNGRIARTALVSFARLKNPELAEWIEASVSFPSSMVDRITPTTTDEVRAEVAREYWIEDEWPVVAESFEQWVLEDSFPAGRPAFERVGVQLVTDVEPYERMKLRLLNASHQAMSYLGILAGHLFVHDALSDPALSQFVSGYMLSEATPTLHPVPGVDLAEYRRQLITRFSSPAVADTLARQVVDGSERIQKFLLPVLRDQLEAGGSIDHLALIIAGWSRFLERNDEDGRPLPVQDHRALVVVPAARAEHETPGALLDVREVFADLGENQRFRTAYLLARGRLQSGGVHYALGELGTAAQ